MIVEFSVDLSFQFIYLISILAGIKADGYKYSARSKIECYSCASKVLENSWSQLKEYYQPQKNFTHYCDAETFDPKKVLTDTCSRQTCVVLRETYEIAGVVAGPYYIRGCIEKILVNGFNESALETHRFFVFEHCRTLLKSRLMKKKLSGFVHMCSCGHSRCNGAASHSLSNAKPTQMPLILLNTLIVALLWKSLMPQ